MDAMFGGGHDDSIARRGLDEALACRDLLPAAPPATPASARVGMWVANYLLRRRQPAGGGAEPSGRWGAPGVAAPHPPVARER